MRILNFLELFISIHKEGVPGQPGVVKQEDGISGGGGAAAVGAGGGPSPEELKNKVFVGGLPLHVDKEGLKEFFSCFGPVTDVSVFH